MAIIQGRLKTPVNSADHALGRPDAPLTLVEYGDFQCPHCAAAVPIVAGIREQFGDDLLVVYRHFPLSKVHPLARPAAEASEFAAEHHVFWEMHDALFARQRQLNAAIILEIAAGLSLDTAALQTALDTARYRQKVQDNFADGMRSGVNGTPTFFINGRRHAGYQQATLVEALLKVPGPRGPAGPDAGSPSRTGADQV